jgi:hypothetical protein
MDYSLVTAEVASLLAAHPGWDDQQIAGALNAKTLSGLARAPIMVRYRTLISSYGPELADGVIDALEAAAAAGNKTLQRILPTILADGESSGIDAANPIVRQVIDALATAGVLSADQAAKIKALGEVPTSRAEQLGVKEIQPGHVARARQLLLEG